MNDNMSIEDFIRDDEAYPPEEEGQVCSCYCCGDPIFDVDQTIGIADGATKIIICESCALKRKSLIDWLDILGIFYHSGEAEDVCMYVDDEILREIKKKTGGDK